MPWLAVFLFLFQLSFANHPFPYDLHLHLTQGKSSKVMILAHGMGGNYQISETVKIDKSLISFNFPDHDFQKRAISAKNTTFGTIDELLPLLYVIKKCVVTDGHSEVDLYGFSAGGGAVINALTVLNTSRFDKSLAKIGILHQEKQKMLQAIQKGLIILDTPLKSIREIIDFRGSNSDLEIFARRYEENGMEPIKSLACLKGLVLHFIVHFQNPDEVLSNRDDDLFISCLKEVNSGGTTRVVAGHDHGHVLPHPSLWEFYGNQSFEARAFVSSIEQVKSKLSLLNAEFMGEYAFQDFLYQPKDKEYDWNREFVRLRVYEKTNWKQKPVVLIYKYMRVAKFKKEYDRMEEANSDLSGYNLSFSFSRKGFEYLLGDVRVFVEEIQGLSPSVELVSPSREKIETLFQNLEVTQIITDSVPKLVSCL